MQGTHISYEWRVPESQIQAQAAAMLALKERADGGELSIESVPVVALTTATLAVLPLATTGDLRGEFAGQSGRGTYLEVPAGRGQGASNFRAGDAVRLAKGASQLRARVKQNLVEGKPGELVGYVQLNLTREDAQRWWDAEGSAEGALAWEMRHAAAPAAQIGTLLGSFVSGQLGGTATGRIEDKVSLRLILGGAGASKGCGGAASGFVAGESVWIAPTAKAESEVPAKEWRVRQVSFTGDGGDVLGEVVFDVPEEAGKAWMATLPEASATGGGWGIWHANEGGSELAKQRKAYFYLRPGEGGEAARLAEWSEDVGLERRGLLLERGLVRKTLLPDAVRTCGVVGSQSARVSFAVSPEEARTWGQVEAAEEGSTGWALSQAEHIDLVTGVLRGAFNKRSTIPGRQPEEVDRGDGTYLYLPPGSGGLAASFAPGDVCTIFKGSCSRVVKVREVTFLGSGGATKSAYLGLDAPSYAMAEWWAGDASVQGENGWEIKRAAAGTVPTAGGQESYEREIARISQELRTAIDTESYEAAHKLNLDLKTLKEKAPVSCRLVLAMHINMLREGSKEREEFCFRFRHDVASALCCPPERVVVRDVGGKSVVVDFTILPAHDNHEATPTQLRETLKDQLKEPSSRIYRGAVTCATDKALSIATFSNTIPKPAGAVQGHMSIDTFTSMARSIFDDKDEDGSDSISTSELGAVLKEILANTGRAMPDDELEAEVKDTLRRYDTDNNGVLSFKEFVRMLCNDPWSALLPPNLKSEVAAIADQLPG